MRIATDAFGNALGNSVVEDCLLYTSLSRIDELGRRTRYAYDGRQRSATVTMPDGVR